MTNPKSILSLLCLLAALFLTASCKPGVPDDYIQPGKMEDILYDYHVAMAMADQGDPAQRNERIVAYKAAVLRKYDVSEQQFDKSMQYYVRHTERLHDIYNKLADRLNDEAKDLGASGTSMTKEYSQNGDTTNVWRGAQSLVLSPEPGVNSYSFTIKVDTAFHKGDNLSLEFNSNYIIQEGSRNAVAVLTVKLKNDSIVSQVTRITSDSRMQTFFGDYGNIGIKEISGYFLFLPMNELEPSTTVKMLFLTNIRLLRIHKPVAQNDGTGSSVGTSQPMMNGPQPSGAPVRPSAPPAAGGASMPPDMQQRMRQGAPVNTAVPH